MAKQSASLTIRELDAAEIPTIYPMVKQTNPELSRAKFTAYLKRMLPLGYRCIGAFQGKKLVGTCGFWVGTRFWCGEYMEADNLVVDISQRNTGVGGVLMRWVEKEAKKLGCKLVIADSYTYNHASHRFYFRERYVIKGFCFVKEISPA